MRTLGNNQLPQVRSGRQGTGTSSNITIPYNNIGNEIEQPVQNSQQLLEAYDKGNQGDPNALIQLANAKKQTANKFENALDDWAVRLTAMQESEWKRGLDLYKSYINTNQRRIQREELKQGAIEGRSTSEVQKRYSDRLKAFKNDAYLYAQKHPTGQSPELLSQLFDSITNSNIEVNFMPKLEQYNVNDITNSLNVLVNDLDDEFEEAVSVGDVSKMVELNTRYESLAEEPDYAYVMGGVDVLNQSLQKSMNESLIVGIRNMIKQNPHQVEQLLNNDAGDNLYIQLLPEDDRRVLLHEADMEIRKVNTRAREDRNREQKRAFDAERYRLTTQFVFTDEQAEIELQQVERNKNAHVYDDAQATALVGLIRGLVPKDKKKQLMLEPNPSSWDLMSSADKSASSRYYTASVEANPDQTLDQRLQNDITFSAKYKHIAEPQMQFYNQAIGATDVENPASVDQTVKIAAAMMDIVDAVPDIADQIPGELFSLAKAINQSVEVIDTDQGKTVAPNLERIKKELNRYQSLKELGSIEVKRRTEQFDKLTEGAEPEFNIDENFSEWYDSQFFGMEDVPLIGGFFGDDTGEDISRMASLGEYYRISKKHFNATGSLELTQQLTNIEMSKNWGRSFADETNIVKYRPPSLRVSNTEIENFLGTDWLQDYVKYRLEQKGFGQIVTDKNYQLNYDVDYFRGSANRPDDQPLERWTFTKTDQTPLLDNLGRPVFEDFNDASVEQYFQYKKQQMREATNRKRSTR